MEKSYAYKISLKFLLKISYLKLYSNSVFHYLRQIFYILLLLINKTYFSPSHIQLSPNLFQFIPVSSKNIVFYK